MEKDKLKTQRPREAVDQGSTWESGFDSQKTPVLPAPDVRLEASSAVPAQEAEMSEDYAPETVVFEIGGFADPQQPGIGNGLGIKIVVPPGLNAAQALERAMMAMLRCSEEEARIAIEREKITWPNYVPEGAGTDRAGNIVHQLRFRQKYAERIAHEPKALKPEAPADLQRYKDFQVYLAVHDADNIRDPYVQYDRWATEAGFFVSDGQGVIGIGTLPSGSSSAPAGLRHQYEQDREAVLQFVIWERLRAKRGSLAKDQDQEHTQGKSLVESMADQLPSLVDLGSMQYYMPARYFNAWMAIHGRVILAQGQLEAGETAAFEQDDLGSKIYQLAYHFAQFAQEQLGELQGDGGQVYSVFGAAHVQTIGQLAAQQGKSLEESRKLLYEYYKLSFAMMQAGGDLMARGTVKTMLQGHDDPELHAKGEQIAQQGRVGAAMLDHLKDQPSARRVNATFYPEAETKDFRQGGEAQKGDDWSEGIALNLSLWHDAERGEWVLEDFTQLNAHKENRAAGAKGDPVPAALFEELNSRLRFPKGALFYRVPDEASYRILRTTEPTTMADWLRYAAIAGLLVGLGVASMGAAIPAQVVMIGSSLLMAGAETADLMAEQKQGMLSSERVLVHGAMIASCILGGANAALGIAAKLGQFGSVGSKVFRVVAGLQVAADGVCVAAFTQEAFASLQAAAHDPEGVTFSRMLAFYLQMGMNGLMLFGMHGSLGEAAGMHVPSTAKPLEAESGGAKAEEKAVDVAKQADEIEASLLARVGGDAEKALKFSKSEILDFVTHAQGLGFGRADIEAILIVKQRKPWVGLDGLKAVSDALAAKKASNNIGFKEGWDFMRAYREAQFMMARGERLPPSTYLEESYIAQHLQQFEGGATYLVTGVNYEQYILPNPAAGYADGQYVSSTKLIDQVLKNADGDISLIEKQLGIPDGIWTGKEGLYRIDIEAPSELNLRMPDGAELGANELWCPGGNTSGGVDEAMVNQIPVSSYDAKPVSLKK